MRARSLRSGRRWSPLCGLALTTLGLAACGDGGPGVMAIGPTPPTPAPSGRATNDPGPSTNDPGPSTNDPGPSTNDPGPSTDAGEPTGNVDGDSGVEGASPASPDASVHPTPMGVGADPGPPAPFVVAPHPPLPVVPSGGGPLLRAPELVFIAYAGQPDVETYRREAEWMVRSRWLTVVGAEYGVGLGSVLGQVTLDEAPPAQLSDDDIQALLAGGIESGQLPVPARGDFRNAVYMILVPETTVVGDETGRSCVDFLGYHGEVNRDGLDFAYAVINDCTDPLRSKVEATEITMTHELIEAATDPFTDSRPGYTFPDTTTNPLALFAEGEVGDLCSISEPQAYHEGEFTAQRSWSNAAAMAGDQDPCVPADPTHPYYNVAAAQRGPTRIAAGGSATFHLSAWSTAAVEPWSIEVEADGDFMPTIGRYRTTMAAGDTLDLTVGVPAGTAPGGTAMVVVISQRSMLDYQVWPLAIVAN